MTFEAIVFYPGEEGQVVSVSANQFSEILAGGYERTFNKHNIPNTVAIIHHEGALINLPYNRGYHGTFILVKEDDYGDNYLSFTDSEIKDIKKKLDNKKNFASQNKFMERFFEEKEIPFTIFHYEVGNSVVQLSNYEVIENLVSIENKDKLKEIEFILRKIDFQNGDVNHFLEYVGQGLAQAYVEANTDLFL